MPTGWEEDMNTQTMQRPVLVQWIITREGFQLVLLHHWGYSNSRPKFYRCRGGEPEPRRYEIELGNCST